MRGVAELKTSSFAHVPLILARAKGDYTDIIGRDRDPKDTPLARVKSAAPPLYPAT
jgi:hypothetical protein